MLVAQGCSSSVYACSRTDQQNPSEKPDQLVVKVCETRGEESILQAARHEANLLKKIDSRHVNRYIDFFEDPLINKTYLVLENAGDKSIKDLVEERTSEDGSYTNPEGPLVRTIMGQLFEATEYLHKRYICHRDLKPDNLIIGKDDKLDQIIIKLIDFNVAVEVSKTNPRIRGGTGLREWSAPETYQSFYSDFKIDSWTLGCVMHYLCTGK